MKIKVQLLDKSIPVPSYAHPGDAGLDLYSTIDLELKPFSRALVPTGIKVEIPRGFAGFIQPKSGLALKHGVSIVNTPGLIDSGYRGEVAVILINLDPLQSFLIKRGQKIAQLVIQKVEESTIEFIDFLNETTRGEGGFGSTGI